MTIDHCLKALAEKTLCEKLEREWLMRSIAAKILRATKYDFVIFAQHIQAGLDYEIDCALLHLCYEELPYEGDASHCIPRHL